MIPGSVIVDVVSLRKHALVQDARNQNSSGVLAIKDNVPAALHSPQVRTNIITTPTQRGIVGQHLATRFQIVDVTSGLLCAPGAKGMSAHV